MYVLTEGIVLKDRDNEKAQIKKLDIRRDVVLKLRALLISVNALVIDRDIMNNACLVIRLLPDRTSLCAQLSKHNS